MSTINPLSVTVGVDDKAGTKDAKVGVPAEVDTSEGKTTLIQPPVGMGLVVFTMNR